VTEQDLEATIRDALLTIAPEVSPGGLDPNLSFRDQFDMDSVDFLNFVLVLEQKTGVKVPELDYPKLSSLAGCVAYLSERQSS
jgi:acyl carrier protein